jgi:hypothetical protein
MKSTLLSLVATMILVAAVFLLSSRPAAAGGTALSNPDPYYARRAKPQPVVVPVYRPAAGVAVGVQVTIPGQPAKAPVYVNLQGPDGQKRRFLVEGGREAIQTQQVVIRPGQSVTLRWVAAK